jgi:hypothetical protein
LVLLLSYLHPIVPHKYDAHYIADVHALQNSKDLFASTVLAVIVKTFS